MIFLGCCLHWWTILLLLGWLWRQSVLSWREINFYNNVKHLHKRIIFSWSIVTGATRSTATGCVSNLQFYSLFVCCNLHSLRFILSNKAERLSRSEVWVEEGGGRGGRGWWSESRVSTWIHSHVGHHTDIASAWGKIMSELDWYPISFEQNELQWPFIGNCILIVLGL